MIGVIVLNYGMVIGFVIFGLGGLMRFRSTTGSTRDTGRLIIVTLIGLIVGLNLPQFAVLATAFAWVLIYIFDGHPVCSLEVSEIPKGRVADASREYRRVLAELKCTLIWREQVALQEPHRVRFPHAAAGETGGGASRALRAGAGRCARRDRLADRIGARRPFGRLTRALAFGTRTAPASAKI